jgi:phage FluMu gp28-like protein
LYFKVTLPDAINFGLVDTINRARGTNISREQFFADCRSRARDEGIFEQAYMCNPLGATINRIVDWSLLEGCRYNYDIIRIHLEHNQILEQFGQFNPASQDSREDEITQFIHRRFLKTFQTKSKWRLGFDVAASGQGDLAVIYIDEVQGSELWLRALFTCRTEDWHFLRTVLFKFLSELRYVEAAGDASGLGRQICWDAASHFGSRFIPVNFGSKKHDLGFALMQQLSTAQKRFPRSEQDIASDFFALRKHYQATRWVFSEGTNNLNPASHCDIAWAGALATHAHVQRKVCAGGMVG